MPSALDFVLGTVHQANQVTLAGHAEDYSSAPPATPATYAKIFLWGDTAPALMQLTATEKASTQGDGYAMLSSGGIIQIADSRYVKGADGHWRNQNHPNQDLGMVTGPTAKPKHGIAGVIQDVEQDPLGAAETALVAVSAAPLVPFLAAAAEGGAVVAGATGNLGNAAKAATSVVTNPAAAGKSAISAGKAVYQAEGWVAEKVTGVKIPGIGSAPTHGGNAPARPPASSPAPVVEQLGFWRWLWHEVVFAVTGES